MNTYMAFDGSFQIERRDTEQNITEAFLFYKLHNLTTYRVSTKQYWLSVYQNKTTTHYVLGDDGQMKVAGRWTDKEAGGEFPIT